MFVPDDAKVREKMLYASTRDSLKRDLGYSFFAADMHVTDRSELSFEAFDNKVLVNEAERRSVMSDVEKLRLQANPQPRSIYHYLQDHVMCSYPSLPLALGASSPP